MGSFGRVLAWLWARLAMDWSRYDLIWLGCLFSRFSIGWAGYVLADNWLLLPWACLG
jgi:hypothetical protein